MGGSLKFGEEEIRVKTEFDGEGKILIRDSAASTAGRTPTVPVLWEGWAWAERMNPWYEREEDREDPAIRPRKGWLDEGKWKRADILASAFNEKFRWYEVPLHEAVKAIVLEREDCVIMKVLSRPARGRECLVTGTPNESGKIEDARFTQTGPRRVFADRLPPQEEIEAPF